MKLLLKSTPLKKELFIFDLLNLEFKKIEPTNFTLTNSTLLNSTFLNVNPDKSTLDNFKLLTFKSDKMIFDRVQFIVKFKINFISIFLLKSEDIFFIAIINEYNSFILEMIFIKFCSSQLSVSKVSII